VVYKPCMFSGMRVMAHRVVHRVLPANSQVLCSGVVQYTGWLVGTGWEQLHSRFVPSVGTCAGLVLGRVPCGTSCTCI
jgi:hypothetical protein